MPQLAAWEKVHIRSEDLTEYHASTHGEIPCVDCHQGNPEIQGANNRENLEYAHAGLVPEPSDREHVEETCGMCHRSTVTNFESSIHANLWGEKNFLGARF